MKFETPDVEIIYLDPADIVTASSTGGGKEEGETTSSPININSTPPVVDG